MLVDGQEFDARSPPPSPLRWRETVFRYCMFDGLDLEGLSCDGILQGCTFTRCDFYWGLFNTALLANVRMVECTFPGTSFRGVRMINCEFERCEFTLDNLGGDCTIDDCLVVDTHFRNCSWAKKPERGGPDITNTRWFACSQVACRGFGAQS